MKTMLSLTEAKPSQRSKTAQSCSSSEEPSKELFRYPREAQMQNASLIHLPSALYTFL